jgi:hypothetical protein
MNNENEILDLLRENNYMLKQILAYISQGSSDVKDFVMNAIANIITNKKC